MKGLKPLLRDAIYFLVVLLKKAAYIYRNAGQRAGNLTDRKKMHIHSEKADGTKLRSEEEWNSRQGIRKGLQYLMLLSLFGLAFFLPAYALKEQAHGSADQGGQAYGSAGKRQEVLQSDLGLEDREKAVSQLEVSEEKKGTIVIDAGHGGDDPGMIGNSGISEKVLNLVYAQKLEDLLIAAGYEVVQTRETEEGLYDAQEIHKKAQDMQRRCAVIAEAEPLLTVSIHQNSYQDPAVCGPQVFYYEQSAEGEKLAACIQECLNAVPGVMKQRVQKGNSTYYILKRSASTTVIVECGFLSNPAEEETLQDEGYQDGLVHGICDGILQYLQEKEGK